MATAFFLSAPIYPGIWNEEKSYVSTAILATGTTLVVDNTQGFTAQDYIIIGEPGSETSEIVQISSITNATTMVIGAVNFNHAIDESVRRTPFNQVKFYQSSTSGGALTIDGTVDMNVDNVDLLTPYGTTTTNARLLYWKITYYNSTTSDETSTSDSEEYYGATVLYCSEQDVRDYLQFYDTEKLNPASILLLLKQITDLIDQKTNTSFRTNTIPVTAYEYHDGRELCDSYFLKHRPIIGVTELSTTQTKPHTTATWDALTEGRDNDFLIYKDLGMIKIIDDAKIPPEYPQSLRIAYVWGRSVVPSDIVNLAVMMVSRQLIKSEAAKDITVGDGKGGGNIVALDADINEIIDIYRVDAHYFN